MPHSTRAGFFRSADIGQVDDQGRLRIVGRIKDIINRGAEKFNVTKVEEVLSQVPGVREIAVVTVPDPDLVKRACAMVVSEGNPPIGADLREATLAAWLAIQKTPEYALPAQDFPQTASGKIQRFALCQAATHRPISR